MCVFLESLNNGADFFLPLPYFVDASYEYFVFVFAVVLSCGVYVVVVFVVLLLFCLGDLIFFFVLPLWCRCCRVVVAAAVVVVWSLLS